MKYTLPSAVSPPYVSVVLLNLKHSKSNQVHHSSLTTSSLPSDSLTLLLALQAPQEWSPEGMLHPLPSLDSWPPRVWVCTISTTSTPLSSLIFILFAWTVFYRLLDLQNLLLSNPFNNLPHWSYKAQLSFTRQTNPDHCISFLWLLNKLQHT